MARNTFETAIRESIRSYFENESFDNLLPKYKKTIGKKIKYDKSFFDNAQKSIESEDTSLDLENG